MKKKVNLSIVIRAYVFVKEMIIERYELYCNGDQLACIHCRMCMSLVLNFGYN